VPVVSQPRCSFQKAGRSSRERPSILAGRIRGEKRPGSVGPGQRAYKLKSLRAQEPPE